MNGLVIVFDRDDNRLSKRRDRVQEIVSRYEFRVCAQNFELTEEKMRKRSKLDKFRESSEIEILSKGNNKNTIKIRYATVVVGFFFQVKEIAQFEVYKPVFGY